MTNNNSPMVSVPVATLNCIKSLLFGEDGVNLSGIINDIASVKDNPDLVAINVALAFKGIKPKIDTAPRFGGSRYDKAITRYDVIAISLINNSVKVSRSYQRWKDGQWQEDTDQQGKEIMSLDRWFELHDAEKIAQIKKEIEERNPVQAKE